MFSEATRVLCALLLGERLPKISDVGFRTVENKTVSFIKMALSFLLAGFTATSTVNRSSVKNKYKERL